MRPESIKLDSDNAPSIELRMPKYRSTGMKDEHVASLELETSFMAAARYLTIEDMRELHAWLGAAIAEASPALVAAE